MAGKKPKRSGPRYLLSGDPRLQKLSLKKLTQPRAKASAPKRAARKSTPSARAAESLRWPWTANPGAIGLAGLGILAAATLFAAGQMSDRPDSDQVSTPMADARIVSEAAPPTPARAEKPVPAKERTPVREKTPAPKPTIAAATTPAATATSGSSSLAASALEPAPAGSVTITGCLAKSKDGFWIKDASGADLSKKRSWRSGFFKKGSPRVDVVAASSAAQLSAHVGERVAATGLLEGQELRARSVRRVAPACN